jgi:hypothetical protein
MGDSRAPQKVINVSEQKDLWERLEIDGRMMF